MSKWSKVKTAFAAVQIAVVYKATLGKFPSLKKLSKLLTEGKQGC